MHRRTFLKSIALAASATALPRFAAAALPKAKITRVRIYQPNNFNPTFNQSNMVVTVETDAGLTGVGEGGSKDTLEQCAGRLIGKDPFQIERLWQDMYRAFFYPPGREKVHALGALDLALWDIKGKALDVPVYDLLGGLNRNHCECYATGGVGGGGGISLRDRARATIQAGYRVFRMDAASVRGGTGFAAFSSAKFGLRAVAQAMARELGPKNIHVVHLIIDAAVDSEAIHQRLKAAKGIDAKDVPADSLAKTTSIANAYWFAHQQSRDGWTHEFDLRPGVEKW